jgi:hypothetical protein
VNILSGGKVDVWMVTDTSLTTETILNVGIVLAWETVAGDKTNPVINAIPSITWMTFRKMEVFLFWLAIIFLSS